MDENLNICKVYVKIQGENHSEKTWKKKRAHIQINRGIEEKGEVAEKWEDRPRLVLVFYSITI